MIYCLMISNLEFEANDAASPAFFDFDCSVLMGDFLLILTIKHHHKNDVTHSNIQTLFGMHEESSNN